MRVHYNSAHVTYHFKQLFTNNNYNGICDLSYQCVFPAAPEDLKGRGDSLQKGTSQQKGRLTRKSALDPTGDHLLTQGALLWTRRAILVTVRSLLVIEGTVLFLQCVFSFVRHFSFFSPYVTPVNFFVSSYRSQFFFTQECDIWVERTLYLQKLKAFEIFRKFIFFTVKGVIFSDFFGNASL